MTVSKFFSDSSLVAEARIVDVGSDPERGYWVASDETIFHPQGGGQKADRGEVTIGGVQYEVKHVAWDATGTAIRHYLTNRPMASSGDRAEMRVDGAHRLVSARHHTAGHLVAALVEARFAYSACGGHHWPGESRVEFLCSVDFPPDELLVALQHDVREAVALNLDVRVVQSPAGDRCIQIGNYPPVKCGGTHLERLCELEGHVEIDRVRVKSERLRVSYRA